MLTFASGLGCEPYFFCFAAYLSFFQRLCLTMPALRDATNTIPKYSYRTLDQSESSANVNSKWMLSHLLI